MGLFDKRPEKLRYDKEECRRKKERMRQIFDRVVEDGDSYRVLLATKDGQPRQQGLFGGSAASRNHYILGYRRDDGRMALVLVDPALDRHSDATFLETGALSGASYDQGSHRACLRYRGGGEPELLYIGDPGSRAPRGIPNVVQEEERTDFLEFLHAICPPDGGGAVSS